MSSSVSYASSSLGPVHFGVGAAAELNDIEIRWPSGKVQRLNHVKTNQILDVREPIQ
jgi:hypothetical protein